MSMTSTSVQVFILTILVSFIRDRRHIFPIIQIITAQFPKSSSTQHNHMVFAYRVVLLPNPDGPNLAYFIAEKKKFWELI